MTIEPIKSDNAPAPVAPYSQAIRAGDFLFLSGQGPIDPQTGLKISGGIEEQVARTMDNVVAILKAAGGSVSDLVKVTMFLRDIGDFQAASKVYGNYFEGPPPARTCIQAGELPLQIGVEIEAIAYLPQRSE